MADNLYEICKHISDQDRKYLYGGGHTKPLSKIKYYEPLDCSGSVSLALYRGGYYPNRDWAFSSWDFMHYWGAPGMGQHFTVWTKSSHCFIQFHNLGVYKRFDTSPWGWGGYGPEMRRIMRPLYGFVPRHWPGMWKP